MIRTTAQGHRQSWEVFVSMEGTLVKVFNRAQEIAKDRKERSMDGGDSDDEAEM